VASSSALPLFAISKKPKVKLRVLGTHVTLQEEIRKKAQEDLGFEIEFEPGGSSYVLQKAATRPDSFDIYEQWSDSINILWQANAIQAIESERITNYSKVNSLSKTGKVTSSAKLGKGDAPYKIINVQKNGALGSEFSGKLSFLPYVHNVDAFGYNTSVVPKGIPYQTESWAWLLDEKWHGKVGMVNAPTIGIFDMALAAEAKGLMKFKDIGAMTKLEIDQLFRIMVDYKEKGHFAGVWNSVPESIDFMRSKRVVIESMFSPAVSTLNGQNIPVVYSAPKEGYRAWHGVMCMSSKTTGYQKDAAYDFMNWWLSGWAGAFIARQGYYISIPELAQEYLSKNEYEYYYKGGVAKTNLPGTDGKIAVKEGASRSGGSYERRLSNIAVWNTVMDTYEYSLLRWYDFLSS